MKKVSLHLQLARTSIITGQISNGDLRETALTTLSIAEKHDILDKVLPPDIDLKDITIDDIQLPSLWQIITKWKFWKQVLKELIIIIIHLIIKSKRQS